MTLCGMTTRSLAPFSRCVARQLTEAHYGMDCFGQGNMTADPAAHAFPDQDDLAAMLRAARLQGCLMSLDKFGSGSGRPRWTSA